MRILLIVLIFLAIPTVLLIASGDFFPKENPPYEVGFISSSTHDTIFVRNAIEGVYDASKSDAINAELYRLPDNTTEGFQKTVARAIEQGSNMIISSGYDAGKPMLESALLHPNTSFVMVDADFSEFPDNFANIVFRSNEPSFIAGYIAGKMTKTGRIGFLGGVESDSVQTFYYGFKAGIDASAAENGKTITLIPYYTDTFSDPSVGYDTGKRMYQDGGVDIIFTVAGDTGLGCIQAAKELDKYVIGVDTDQNYLAPLNVLFSVTKCIPTVVSEVVKGYAEDDSPRDEDGLISVGYADYGVAIATVIDDVPAGVQADAAALEGLIREGKISVPSTKAEYDAWALPIFIAP